MNETVLTRRRLLALTVAALGVVYGDIGTSPLYALKECFKGQHSVEPTPGNVLGVLSLIIWCITLIVGVKYIGFVMRADNRGEGGILALLALTFPEKQARTKTRLGRFMVLFGVFGATLLYGDGIITPAISVLGAVEGLEKVTPAFKPVIVPLTVVILVGLFSAQRFGTGRVGQWFGLWTAVWFATIAVLGIRGILLRPEVFQAVNPAYAVLFFVENGWMGFKVLGAVVLVVTGGEALYADMGHFGARPIRLAWFTAVMPALVLNYLGQGALVLSNPLAKENPFYGLCPDSAVIPLVILATGAAVIASQALISGAFSMTMHATQLGFMPRMVIEHTSKDERGQIYMPQINWLLMFACLGLVLGFKTSSNLASAYGVAVTITMGVTSVLFYFAARHIWGWSRLKAGAVVAVPLLLEVAFCVANLGKIPYGGWFPLLLASLIFTVMATWKRGRQLLWKRVRDSSLPAETFIADIERREPQRVAGTAVYLAGNSDGTPIALLHNLKHNKVLHKRVVFLTIIVEEASHVPEYERVEVEKLDAGFWRVRGRYGFMEQPDVPQLIRGCAEFDLELKESETTYFVSRETIIPSKKSGMALWRERMFAVLSRNAQSATTFFHLPPNRVVELGMQVEI
ncbi:MAG: potassium transporter Kup [Pedosphaera sp.]|nr:potassium transporter Kup [Pedosphaera sp.]